MRKILLLCLAVSISLFGLAQDRKSRENLPAGFKRAVVPASAMKYSHPERFDQRNLERTVPVNNLQSRRMTSPVSPNTPAVNLTEKTIGYTFYDVQTNATINNRVVKNADGTVSAVWTFSPNSTANWPQRGTGYDYFNGIDWIYSSDSGNIPNNRIEPTNRTGYTNIAVTADGKENVIAHSSTLTHVLLSSRPIKGTGVWTEHTTSLGLGTNNDTWCKAVAAGSYVYAICQGAGANTPATPLYGQDGPILFSRSNDGGVTWQVVRALIPPLDSNYYLGFGADNYSIDARDSIVSIAFGDITTDLGIVKSTDYGSTWTKTVIHAFPIPFFDINTMFLYYSGGPNPDTVEVGNDPHVLIDNQGMCHVFWGALRWTRDSTTAAGYFLPLYYNTDALNYWNESMAPEAYQTIASVWDCSGTGTLNFATPSDTTCTLLGTYHGGLTQLPSAGIDHTTGEIYVTYQSVCNCCDTNFYHQLYKHVYIIKSSNGGLSWTLPEDIVPSTAVGGSGQFQEAVYACIAKIVDNDAWVVYQRDGAPGNSLSTNTCEAANNNSAADIIAARITAPSVGINNVESMNAIVTQNYPNPAHGITSINIGLKIRSDISIKITDMLGKLVHSDLLNNAESGLHTVTLNTTGLNPGIYFYTVEAGKSRVTKKMIVD